MSLLKNVWAIHRFAFTHVIVLVILELILLAAVLGVIGAGYGAFHVVWFPSEMPNLWERAIFWNGFGVATFILTISYMIYLLYAYKGADVPEPRWGWDRFGLYFGIAVLPLAASTLPAILPSLFTPGLDESVAVKIRSDGGYRFAFLPGMAVGILLFIGLVELLTWGGRRFWKLDQTSKDAKIIYRQMDSLFAFVNVVYFGIVGFTLVDNVEGIGTGYACVLVLMLAILAMAMRKPRIGVIVTSMLMLIAFGLLLGAGNADAVDRTRLRVAAVSLLALLVIRLCWFIHSLASQQDDRQCQRIGRIGTVAIAIFILFFVVNHGRHVGTAWDWGYLIVAAGIGIVVIVMLRALRDPVRARLSVGYTAGTLGFIVLGTLLGALIGLSFFGGKEMDVLPAALSVCLLLAAIGSAYAALWAYAKNWYYPVLIAVIGGLIIIGTIRPYPHQIEELAPEYAKADISTDDPALEAKAKYNLNDYLDNRLLAPPAQLIDHEVLEQWRKQFAASDTPPLVIVTVAGGASVSAIYTYDTLMMLEEAIPGFSKYVRLITGASGGMVGAAYYRSVLFQHAEAIKKDPKTVPLAQFLKDRRDNLKKDFLSPIVHGMAFKDIPMGMLCPIGFADDRGRRLERALQKHTHDSLELTFEELREQERTGQYPSLIFSPMIVEDGRPLLISTLDLDKLAVLDETVFDEVNEEHYDVRMVRAFEMMRLFPGSAWNLRLGTAARLNASFPFFSPAATLPTIPPRRVVDAGYLDNYGMAVALAWVRERAVYREHVQSHTKRIVLIELRPYLDWRSSILDDDEWNQSRVVPGGEAGTERRLARVSPFVSPFQELTSPAAGAGAALKAGMIARNDMMFEYTRKLAATKNIQLINVAFRGALKVSLNWTLSPDELNSIDARVNAIRYGFPIGEGINHDEFKRLQKVVPGITK